jgi:hypothetical protein
VTDLELSVLAKLLTLEITATEADQLFEADPTLDQAPLSRAAGSKEAVPARAAHNL